jgi:hypothetical protein
VSDGGERRIIDYGIGETGIDEQGGTVEQRIYQALQVLYEQLIGEGFLVDGSTQRRGADIMLIDSGFCSDTIFQFTNAPGVAGVYAIKGYGSTQKIGRGGVYRTPLTDNTAIYVGDEYHVGRHKTKNVWQVHINVDVWKYRVQESLVMPDENRVALFDVRMPREHFSFSKHITSEQVVEEFVEGKGVVRRWEAKSRNNHWLDATGYAYVGADFGGVLLDQAAAQSAQGKKTEIRSM